MLGLFVRIKTTLNERSDRGAAMAEYGLLLVLVALAAVAILSIFGETLAETFGFASETLDNSPALNGGN